MTDGMTASRRAARPRRALLLALALTGCSFRFIYPAPPRREWPDPVVPSSSENRCTNVLALPIADTIVGAGLGTLSYVERHSGSPTITLGLGVAAIPALVSAVYGYVQTDRCRRYHALFTQQQPDGPPQQP